MFYQVPAELDDEIYDASSSEQHFTEMLEQAENTGFLVIGQFHYVNQNSLIYLRKYFGMKGKWFPNYWWRFKMKDRSNTPS